MLGAFEKQTDPRLGRQLVESLSQSPASSALRADLLRACLTSFPEDIRQQGEELLARLNVDLAEQQAHLQQLQASLLAGDVRRGQAVFNSSKAACSTCHQMGYLGGKLGPDLTRIGQIRSPADLLESIVYPSASFVRSYEPTLVITHSGKSLTGIMTKDSSDEVILVSEPDRPIRIGRDEIDEVLPGRISVMPTGMDKVLTPQELADIIAFLSATRW